MEKEKVGKYPLVKDYDFESDLSRTRRGGKGVLLIPKNGKYGFKHFGYGELCLFPPLQELFKESDTLYVRDFLEDLCRKKRPGRHILWSGYRFHKGNRTFFEKAVRKFFETGLLSSDNFAEGEKFNSSRSDSLSKGDNYDLARVYRMTPLMGPFEEYIRDIADRIVPL